MSKRHYSNKTVFVLDLSLLYPIEETKTELKQMKTGGEIYYYHNNFMVAAWYLPKIDKPHGFIIVP